MRMRTEPFCEHDPEAICRCCQRCECGVVVRWEAYETESHGYSWELHYNGAWFASVSPANGDGMTGRDEVARIAGNHDGAAAIAFHTFAAWLEAEGAEA